MYRLLLATAAALALGVGAAALVACGGTQAGIPAADADNLVRQIGDIREFVGRGECAGIAGQLSQVQEGVDNLPSATDRALVQDLESGLTKLRTVSLQECNAQPEATVPTTETVTTTTATTTVGTAPTTTTPTTTTPTEPVPTVPPPTTTTPTPIDPAPEPAPAPAPVDSGGAAVDPSPGGAEFGQ